ncbi:uncharacterized protein FQA47_010543 [Oryzias melastigma]|uniref:Arginine vasopressin-induced protein 1 n=1 Tax=Oryzias melastigma TaxID=30732 RepID=A0A834CHA0_ORYME|nr:uncharacterized protein FQA47_010543 [Oryzias melastigma]
MDSSPPGPSSLWRLAERRSRKAGSGNIFSNVNLWQLQRLFKAAGDHDAEQRAKLVWGLRDEADLAQALIGLRARSHRKRLRTNGRSALGSHWLQAFSHLRIEEISSDSQVQEADEESDSESGAQTRSESYTQESGGSGTPEALPEDQSPEGTSERPVPASSGLKRGGESNPDRYLHQILH